MENHLIPGLKELSREFPLNIQYLASDDLRKDVLGNPGLDLRDPKNMHRLKFASDAAFRRLEFMLDQASSFPINAEFIIVDTTALNTDFRRQMIEIARKNNYTIDLLLFDLTSRAYYKYANGADYVSKHVRRMRSEVLPNLGSNYYGQVLRIRDRENPPEIEEIIDYDLYRRCHLQEEAVVLGDIHGCLDKLLRIEKAAGKLPLIVLGDVIDKGPDSLEVLRHLKENEQKYPLRVLGNHEAYVYRYLNGWIENESPAHDYYTTIPQYEGNSEFKDLIDWYFETSVPFVKIRESIYVTHAPCQNKYIGKLDQKSLRKQRYVPITDDLLRNIQGEAHPSFPRHIFGHVAFDRALQFRNKTGIDTGGVYGNVFSYFKGNQILGFDAEKTYSENRLFEVTETGIDPSELDGFERKRIGYCIREKINFVSGTIAPTASDKTRMKIEPIETAIEKFRDCGVELIHVQQKYMGSRCEAYVSRDLEQCFLSSRNGYRIKRLHDQDGEEISDLNPVFESILARPEIVAIFEKYPEAETILLDGELMPWYALGKRLIESQYRLIERAVSSEFEMLRLSGFEEILATELESENYKRYCDNPKISDSIVNSNKKTTFKNLRNYRHVPLDEMERYLQIYREQIEIYGSAKAIEYFPFDILKIINRDGTEIVFRDIPVSERYEMVARDKGMLIDLRNETEVAKLVEHFQNLPDDVEGLVLKCEKPGRSRIYMLKVRNEKYLSIIYGFDYLEPVKNAALINRKSVSRKLAVSNREYELGLELASIPRNRIEKDNEEYQRLLAALIFEERKETALDPRL